MNNSIGKPSVIVVGAGIVGLAAARALAIKGYKVQVIEKSEQAQGASIRNFGMVWPIGQPLGKLYDRAMRSKEIWKGICEEAGIWHATKGSLQVVYSQEEFEVLTEFVDINHMHRKVSILSADACLNASPVVCGEQLVGGMFCEDEVIVESREAIRLIPQYLEERYDIKFNFSTCVYNIEATTVHTNMGKFEADEIYICSGPEFEALYPEVHLNSGLTKCKLQMLRTIAQPESSAMGPALCSGLTLLHYDSFKTCTTLQKVVELNNAAYPEYIKYGIHLLVSQNQYLEMTIGDSHEYGLSPDPFNRAYINDLIMRYFNQFVKVPHLEMQQTWNGVYAKMKKGTELVVKPADGITVVNGLGGAGMTLSFGLLEEVVNGTYSAL